MPDSYVTDPSKGQENQGNRTKQDVYLLQVEDRLDMAAERGRWDIALVLGHRVTVVILGRRVM